MSSSFLLPCEDVTSHPKINSVFYKTKFLSHLKCAINSFPCFMTPTLVKTAVIK